MPSVSIILATCNGETFLSEQLDSIRRCSSKDVTLIVVDDNSSDDTNNIVSQYDIEMNIKKFKSNSSEKDVIRRIKENFILGLEKAESDYYFYCDQDDVWGEQKIQIYMQALSENNIVYGNYSTFGTFLKNVYVKDFNKMSTLNLFVSNVCPGMSVAFDNDAKKALLQNANVIRNHDHGLFLCARKRQLRVKKINLDGLNWYRQHDNNAIGLKKISRSKKILIQLQKLFTNFLIYNRMK